MTRATDLYRTNHTQPVLKYLHEFRVLLLIQKFVHHKHKLPNVFKNYFVSNDSVHMHDTRHKTDLHRHKINTSYGYRCLKYKGINMWNSLPNNFKYITSTTRFKHLLKNYLLSTAGIALPSRWCFWFLVFILSYCTAVHTTMPDAEN